MKGKGNPKRCRHEWHLALTPYEGNLKRLIGASCERCGSHYGNPWPWREDGPYLGPVAEREVKSA